MSTSQPGLLTFASSEGKIKRGQIAHRRPPMDTPQRRGDPHLRPSQRDDGELFKSLFIVDQVEEKSVLTHRQRHRNYDDNEVSNDIIRFPF